MFFLCRGGCAPLPVIVESLQCRTRNPSFARCLEGNAWAARVDFFTIARLRSLQGDFLAPAFCYNAQLATERWMSG